MNIPPEQQFHFHDGTSVADLEGLKRKIESIGYDEFYSHVNEEKNDFAAWVEGVLQNKELADKLRAVTSIVETVELLNEALYPGPAEHSQDDLQERIEESLFKEDSDARGAAQEPSAPVPSMDDDAQTTAKHVDDLEDELSVPSPEAESWSDEEVTETADESEQLPSVDEELPTRLPGAPVTSTNEAFTPVTERVDRPVTHEEHLRFIVKQFLYGFLLGLILGYILANVMNMML